MTRLVWEAQPLRDSFQLLLSGCSPVTSTPNGRAAARPALALALNGSGPLKSAAALAEYESKRTEILSRL